MEAGRGLNRITNDLGSCSRSHYFYRLFINKDQGLLQSNVKITDSGGPNTYSDNQTINVNEGYLLEGSKSDNRNPNHPL